MRFALPFVFVSFVAFGSPTRILFVGDTGTGNSNQYQVGRGMADHCAANGCDFGILLGDNFYPVGVKSTSDPQWQTAFVKPYERLKLVFYPVLGNHDYQGNIKAEIDYSQINPNWRLPAPYHHLVMGQAHVFIIDTDRWNADQAAWLKRELAKSQARWKLVAGHHPVFSYGAHGNTPALIKDLGPILQGHASFYLAGHDHDKQVLVDNTVHYIVCGTGSDTRPSQGGPMSLFHSSQPGFCHLTLDEKGAKIALYKADGTLEYSRSW